MMATQCELSLGNAASGNQQIPAPAAKPERAMGHRERVALRKLGDPSGFRFHGWQVIGGDATVLKGCVCSGATYTRGPRKGRIRYDGPEQVAVVTEAEVEAERVRFIQETGKCGVCCGDGDVFKRWHHIEGTTYRPCSGCNGSGLHDEATSHATSNGHTAKANTEETR